MAKAFDELSALGWIEGAAPRMVVVQAAGCAPVVKAFRNGRKRAEPWRDPHTIAKGIRVPETPADSLLLDLLARTGGTAIAVPDSAILEAHHRVARLEGVSASLEGAAALAALLPLVARRWITRQDTIVVVNSGSGLKPGHSAPAKER
jgi:threonine synthase